jgi:hypothetical protein
MKSLDAVYEIIQTLNKQAYDESWDSWIAADDYEENEDEDEDEDVTAESLREEASLEQAEYFRNFYSELSQDDQDAIKYWIRKDESLRDEFSSWYGQDEFEEAFASNQ